jgi:competence protein ComEA
MWKEKLLTLSPNLRSNILPLFLAVLGVILLGAGLVSSLAGTDREEDITFESSNSDQDIKETKIVVDIQGAVVAPGVYELPSESRIKDVLIAASGLSSDADREWISKNLNQAAKLTDGGKIYIPKVGESNSFINLGQAGSLGVTASGLININSSSQSELESLPGIGPVTAGKIIDNRPYAAIEDLRSKKVVGQSVFDKIKDKISVY